MSKRSAQVVEKRDQSRHSGRGQSKPHILADHVWLVLARRAYSEPLCQVGTVEADDSELARVYAQAIYDEFAWIEMVLVPRETMVTVIES